MATRIDYLNDWLTKEAEYRKYINFPHAQEASPMSLDSWPSKNYRVLTIDEAVVFHRLGVTVYKLPKKVEAAKNCLYKPLDKAFGDGSISDKMSDQMLKRLWGIGDNYDYAIEEE